MRLREGQHRIVDLLNDPNSSPRRKQQLIAVLPTGYGKTLSICCAYAALRAAGVVQRLLIIVPSAEQLGSYLDEIEADMRRVGAPVSGAYRAVSDLSLRLHRQNQAEVFVATVQSLANSGMATVTDLLTTGRWMLAADEFHRYADDNTWGNALKLLTPVFTIAVSATPDRTDRALKAIEGDADVKVSLDYAVKEGAIRRVVTHVMDYTVDITMGGEDVPERFTLAELANSLGGSDKLQDISQIEVKKEIRYYSKYVSEALLNAVSKLEELNLEHPGEHKMLVFALGVRHAQAICSHLRAVAPQLQADWIGTFGTDKEGKKSGKNEADNESVLERFKKGDLQVLVQVRKAAEGFNDVRCSVLLFLNLLNRSVLLQQAVGRGLRRNYAIPEAEDVCHVFVSHDHPGAEYLKALAEGLKTDEDQEVVINERPGAGGAGGPVIYDIPEFFIIDAAYSGEELYFPLGDTTMAQSVAVEKVKQAVPQLQNQSDEATAELIRQVLGIAPQPISTSERISRAKERVTKAVNTLASNVVRIRADRANGTLPSTLVGDTIKAIHQRWKRQGGNSQSSMTLEELETKYKWVQAINTSIRNSADSLQTVISEAPWLML